MLASLGEGGLELGADSIPRADLLGEDLVTGNAVHGERVQLWLRFLGQVRLGSDQVDACSAGVAH